MLKESLHNIAKHAGAKVVSIKIELEKSQKKFQLTITDDGKGFSINERTGSGNGLINMKKRMNEIKGNIQMISSEGRGTIVNVTVPL